MAMSRAVAEFTLADGETKVLFEVPEPSAGDAIENASIGETIYKVANGAAGTFEKAIDQIQPVADAIMSRFTKGLTTPASEVEVKFGLSLTADAGVLISSVRGSVTFEVTLKWQKES